MQAKEVIWPRDTKRENFSRKQKQRQMTDSDNDSVTDVKVTEKNVSKSELKARKAFAKLGLKELPDVTRVVIRRANNSMFVINEADVFKNANGDSNF